MLMHGHPNVQCWCVGLEMSRAQLGLARWLIELGSTISRALETDSARLKGGSRATPLYYIIALYSELLVYKYEIYRYH
jgi:hypothetical protein